MKRWIVTGMCLAAAAPSVVTTHGAQDQPTSGLAAARSAVEAHRRELWRLSIQAPGDTGDSCGLQEAIDRLRKSMHLPKRREATTKTTETRPSETATTKTAETRPTKTATTKAATTRPRPISPAILAKFRKLKPRSVADTAALADALFLAGHPDSAANFYGMAAKGEASPKEKAWLLFQAANCRRKTDPQAALKVYDTLVAAHPDTLWGAIALVQKGIVEWRRTDSLAVLLKEIEKQNEPSSGSPGRK